MDASSVVTETASGAELVLPAQAEVIWGLFAWGVLMAIVVGAIVIAYFRVRASRQEGGGRGPYCSHCGQLRAAPDHPTHSDNPAR